MLHKQAIRLIIEDVPTRAWFSQYNRDILTAILEENWIRRGREVSAVAHLGQIWLFSKSIDENIFQEDLIYITSCIARSFLSRVRSSFVWGYEYDPEHLRKVIRQRAEIHYEQLPKQIDLFNTPTVDNMGDWFLNGTWITTPSTQ